MACGMDSLTSHLTCILTYDGSVKDVIINYTLLFLNLIVAVFSVIYSKSSSYSLVSTPVESQHRKRDLKRSICAIVSLLFVSIFQVVLCLLVQCTGVSIIWCAIGGWILMDHYYFYFQEPILEVNGGSDGCGTHCSNIWVLNRKLHQVCSLIIDLGAIIYYAMIMEPLTTVAHMLAVTVLGIPLYFLYNWIH